MLEMFYIVTLMDGYVGVYLHTQSSLKISAFVYFIYVNPH